jgi:hypothetical protein
MYADVSAVCSKEGDKGKGWSVKSYMAQGSKQLYCLYDGTFRLRPQPDGNNLCPKAPKRRKYMTSLSESCTNDKVHLDTYVPSRRQKYLIKPIFKKGADYPFYNIIDKKGKDCSKIYLSAPDKNDFVVDYEDPQPIDPIPLSLSGNSKWQWLLDNNDLDICPTGSIDCSMFSLRSVNRGTYINIYRNERCNKFVYNPYFGYWIVEPTSE